MQTRLNMILALLLAMVLFACSGGDVMIDNSVDGDEETQGEGENEDGLDGDIESAEEGEADGADSEGEAELEINPEDVEIGKECPEKGLSVCFHQTIVACTVDLLWVQGVSCVDDGHLCWNGECVDPENIPDYPSCVHGDSYCLGNVIHACTIDNEWVIGTDCSEDGHICRLGECFEN